MAGSIFGSMPTILPVKSSASAVEPTLTVCPSLMDASDCSGTVKSIRITSVFCSVAMTVPGVRYWPRSTLEMPITPENGALTDFCASVARIFSTRALAASEAEAVVSTFDTAPTPRVRNVSARFRFCWARTASASAAARSAF